MAIRALMYQIRLLLLAAWSALPVMLVSEAGLPPLPGAESGQRGPRPSHGAIWAAITGRGIVSPRRSSPSRSVAPTTTPNQRPRISQPPMRTSRELIAAQLPEIVVMHDASHDSQVRSCSGQLPGGDQALGRSQDAYHDSMGRHGAR
jgi:hypothetical protein